MADKNVRVRITGDYKSAQAALKGTAQEVGGLKGMIDGANKTLGINLGRWVSVAGAVALAGKAIRETTQLIRESVDAAGAQERADAMLASVLKNVGQYSREAFRGLKDYASELQRTTTFSDDATEGAMKMLGTFKMTADDIKRTVPLLLDMAAALEKQTGQAPDLEQLAIQIGKTYSGESLGMLRRFGVMVDENAFKTKGFQAVLEELEAEFGGAAADAAATYTGRLRQLRNALDDLKEVVGFEILPSLTELDLGLTDLLYELQNSDAARGFGQSIGEMVKASTPALLELTKLITEIMPSMGEMFETVGPLLTDALEEAGPAIKVWIDTLATGVKAAGPMLEGLLKVAGPVLDSLAIYLESIGAVIEAWAPALESFGDALSEVSKAVGPVMSIIAKAVSLPLKPLEYLGKAVSWIIPDMAQSAEEAIRMVEAGQRMYESMQRGGDSLMQFGREALESSDALGELADKMDITEQEARAIAEMMAAGDWLQLSRWLAEAGKNAEDFVGTMQRFKTAAVDPSTQALDAFNDELDRLRGVKELEETFNTIAGVIQESLGQVKDTTWIWDLEQGMEDARRLGEQGIGLPEVVIRAFQSNIARSHEAGYKMGQANIEGILKTNGYAAEEIPKLTETIMATLDKGPELQSLGEDGARQMLEGLLDGTVTNQSALNDSISLVLQLLGILPPTGADIGADLGQSLIDEINRKFDAAEALINVRKIQLALQSVEDTPIVIKMREVVERQETVIRKVIEEGTQHFGGIIRHLGGLADYGMPDIRPIWAHYGRLAMNEVPAILERGEVVLRKEAVRDIGADLLMGTVNRGRLPLLPVGVGMGGGVINEEHYHANIGVLVNTRKEMHDFFRDVKKKVNPRVDGAGSAFGKRATRQ